VIYKGQGRYPDIKNVQYLENEDMQLVDSSYTRLVKGDFVLNFFAMATGLVVAEFV